MRAVENLNVRGFSPLASPRALKSQVPIGEAANQTVFEAREAIKRILRREDNRLVAVVGPCSIHDPAAALEYAARLAEAAAQFRDRLLIVMRVYLEKPRTTVGWRGLINDPFIDGSFDMAAGLRIARELLQKINSMGLPTACEMLDPISPQYIDDLISFAAIGARTTESQTHRALASGLSMPVGFKNSTDGGVLVAVHAMVSMHSPHSFLGIDDDGRPCVVRTAGNGHGVVILRGSKSKTNYDAESIAAAEQMLRAADLRPALMVDCSHANSNYDHARQQGVWETVLAQRAAGDSALIGMMVESNLYEGKQSIPEDLSQLRYGVSITDACVGWETTERMLSDAYAALKG
jgi:3-deoxy-7-phosphoheptulonate synthase